MSQAIKVGIFVTICLLLLGWLIFQVEDWNPFAAPGETIDVLFDSVAGLGDKAPVRVAGVEVGKVDGIALDGRRARVTLALDQPLSLPVGSRAAVASSGILGDKFVELIPGPAGGAPLQGEIVLEGETPVSFDEALERFDSLGQSLQAVTGEIGRDGDIGQLVRSLLMNLDQTSQDIRRLIEANRSEVDSTVSNFENFSGVLAENLPILAQQISDLVARVDGLVADNEGKVGESLSEIQELTAELKVTATNLGEITDQVRSGEGSVGKLLYSDQAHDQLVTALSAVESGVDTLSETLGAAKKLELTLGIQGAAYAEGDDNYAAFDLRLQSHPRRFYRAGIVQGPVNKESTETRTLVTTNPDGSTSTTIIEETLVEDDFTFDAQVGYSFADFDIRGGLFESTGGAGLDYYLWQRRVVVTLEAFDFDDDGDDDPHLRFITRYQINPNLFVLGGYDDALNDGSDSIFIGAGIRWQDNDVKALLGAAAAGL